ncbi:MAG: hypothetical protein ACFCUM_07580 [Bacteroidales bacterium]
MAELRVSAIGFATYISGDLMITNDTGQPVIDPVDQQRYLTRVISRERFFR